MNEQRVARLVEARQLEELSADDAEVSGIWRAALREWGDASVQGLSAPGRFTHLYQAAFRGATALVRAAGYRCRGALGGHHHVTFHAAGALGDRHLERLSDALQELRGERHRALYGDEDDLEEAEIEAAGRLVAEFLAAVHGWLVAQRAGLAGALGVAPRSE